MIGDVLSEVWISIRNNRMRVALTGLSIGWGIFILIILVGAGNGIVRGIKSTFSSLQVNRITLTPGKRALPWNGLEKDTPVELEKADLRIIRERWGSNVTEVLPMIDINAMVSHLSGYFRTQVTGTNPGYMPTQSAELAKGRDINAVDIRENRKVCVIAERLARTLFKSDADNAIGQYITFNGTAFKVVGIYRPTRRYNNLQSVFIPLSVMVKLWNQQEHYSRVILTVDGLYTAKENEDFKVEMRHGLGEMKNFSPDDTRAVSIGGDYEFYVMIMGVLSALKFFIWFIGIATLVSGVVGISNIMMIAVKERTRELGVRKAMGASNASIIRLVLLESVFISVIFGYIGMMAGIGLTQLLGMFVTQATAGQDYTVIGNTAVDIGTIIAANVIMVIAGLIAGYVPARRAVSMKLAEALTS